MDKQSVSELPGNELEAPFSLQDSGLGSDLLGLTYKPLASPPSPSLSSYYLRIFRSKCSLCPGRSSCNLVSQ